MQMHGTSLESPKAAPEDEVALFIHSHRRSGTHLLLDTIRESFDIPDQFFALELLPEPRKESGNSLTRFPNYYLIIDHEPIWRFKLSTRHIWDSEQRLKRADRLYREGKHVYIVRSPLEVLRSLYLFDINGAEPKFAVDQKTSFRDYLLGKSLHEQANAMNRMEYWANHVASWCRHPRVLVIQYQDLKQSATECLKAISTHFGIPVHGVARSVAPSGIATGLTNACISKGVAPSWDAEMVDTLWATIAKTFDARSIETLRDHLAQWYSEWALSAAA